MSRRTVLIRLFAFLVLNALVFVAMLPSSARAVCPDGMISYWKLNETTETTGDVYLDDYNGNDGFCAGTCPTPATGRIDGGQLFDGSTTGISVLASDSFNWTATESFSIEYWMKRTPGTLTGNEVIIGRDDPITLLHWWSGIWSGGEAAFVLKATNGDGTGVDLYLQGTTDLTDGVWHHIVVIRDASTWRNILYVDGQVEASVVVTYSEGFDSATAALNIGWLNFSPYYHFDGTLDEIALYNGVLFDTEISQHYYDGLVGLRWGYCGCGRTVRIMPLGNSITVGSNVVTTDPDYQVGYRQKLYLDLIGRAYDVDFVGGLQAGQLVEPGFDYDHEGHGGWTDGDVAADVYGWLQEKPADVVLLHIGTNSLDTSPSDVEDILDGIDSYSEDISVILARIINGNPYNPTVTEFNDNVQAMAENRIANGDKIIIVNQESALTYPDDMEDLLHPNTTGYEKMAGIWLNALDDFLPLCGPTAPIITSSPVTTATVGIPYTYDVNASGNPNPTYSLSSVPDAGIDIDTSTGLISWTPGTAGDFDVTVAASNVMGMDNQTFTITVAEADFPVDMISYWTLNETLGDSYADVTNGNDGTCAYACPIPTIGRVNGGQAFDGNTTGIDVPADPSFDCDWDATESFSIEYWMKRAPGTLAHNEVIVGRDDSNTFLHWWTGIWSEGEAAFVLMATNGDGTGTDLYLQGTTDLTDGSWHHIVVVRDASTESNILYVDGRDEASVVVTYSEGFDSVTAALNIGWLNFGGGYHFRGTLDELALYDRALPDVEIQQHYINGLAEYGYCTVFAPEIISTAVAEATVGWLYTYDVNAAGNPAPTYTLDIPAPFGMTIDSESGLISWTPTAGDIGTVEVTVVASNGDLPDASDASQTFTITVTVNSPPVAIDDAYGGVDEGGILTIDAASGVLANDSDTENDSLTAMLVTSVLYGTLSFDADGSFEYTHDGSENTSDTFTYKANDGIADSNVATVSITINPVNDAPVAIDDAYGGVDEGGTLTINAASGVLGNDSDIENDPLTAVLVSPVSHGTLTLNLDGSFTYTHNGTENTSDSFTYKANDGIADSNVATVSITINPVNDAPVAIDDAYGGVDEGGTLTINAASGVLANDSDTENDSLTAVLVTIVSYGTLSFDPDGGAFTYIHDGSENTSDSFTYRANDGIADSNVATVTITIIPRRTSLPGVLLLLL